MDQVYLYAATIGGALLVLQLLMTLIGSESADAAEFDAEVDLADAADAQNSFLKMLSLKALIAFATFFGLAGLAGERALWDAQHTLLAAAGAGLGGFFLVGWLMTLFGKLQSKGNLDLGNAVGRTARVYLRVPAEHSGSGRITVSLQGRKVECRAVTAGPELGTGTDVRIRSLRSPGTLEVEALD